MGEHQRIYLVRYGAAGLIHSLAIVDMSTAVDSQSMVAGSNPLISIIRAMGESDMMDKT
jgi:hypothetical protein